MAAATPKSHSSSTAQISASAEGVIASALTAMRRPSRSRPATRRRASGSARGTAHGAPAHRPGRPRRPVPGPRSGGSDPRRPPHRLEPDFAASPRAPNSTSGRGEPLAQAVNILVVPAATSAPRHRPRGGDGLPVVWHEAEHRFPSATGHTPRQSMISSRPRGCYGLGNVLPDHSDSFDNVVEKNAQEAMNGRGRG
jgi:hypothetical protein